MVNGKRGRSANDTKIRNAIKNAKSTDEVHSILENGRFNLTPAQEWKVVQEWKKDQERLRVHGKGVYAPNSPVMVVA